jgi:hypothetical protein
MKVIYCDICGKEIKKRTEVDILNNDMFIDRHDDLIEDVCEECFKWIYCCVIMMKETGWKPDFHEKLDSKDIWESDKAGYVMSDLQNKTGLKLF